MHYAHAMYVLCIHYVTMYHMIILMHMSYSLRDTMYVHMHIMNTHDMNNTYIHDAHT